MNDKLKNNTFNWSDHFASSSEFYFFGKRSAATLILLKLRRQLSAKVKVLRKTVPDKDADLHEIYLAGGCFWELKSIFTSSRCDRCRFWLCEWQRRNNPV